MKEIIVKSEIIEDHVTARKSGIGIKIFGGWLEKGKALEFAEKLVKALKKEVKAAGD